MTYTYWRPSPEPGFLSRMIDAAKARGFEICETSPASRRAYKKQSCRIAKQRKPKT